MAYLTVKQLVVTYRNIKRLGKVDVIRVKESKVRIINPSLS